MKPFKNRKLDRTRSVEVYRNLHRRDGVWYSVRQGGLIVAHARRITLRDATFVVREAGRQRVLATGRKNVHAWVRGKLAAPLPDLSFVVRYNPRRFGRFYTDANCTTREAQIDFASHVVIGKRVTAMNPRAAGRQW